MRTAVVLIDNADDWTTYQQSVMLQKRLGVPVELLTPEQAARFVPDTNQLIAQLASGECDMGTQDAAFEGSLPLIQSSTRWPARTSTVRYDCRTHSVETKAKDDSTCSRVAGSVSSSLRSPCSSVMPGNVAR